MDRVNGTGREDKPTNFEVAGALLGAAMTHVVNGQRAVYGGHTLAGIVSAAVALGVDPHQDEVSIEAHIAAGGSGFYVVDEVGGVKEIREA